MKTIHKIDITNAFNVRSSGGGAAFVLPAAARIVLVDEQLGKICVGYEFDAQATSFNEIWLLIVPTGHRVNDSWRHLASLKAQDGYHIWHVYQSGLMQ